MDLAYQFWKSKKENSEGLQEIPFIFLHGMGGTGKLWRPIAASLEDHFSVLAPDQRGHGGSRDVPFGAGDSVQDFTALAYAEDIVELQARLGCHPAWIVGHSMGVRTACALVHLKSEWVRGMVLIDIGFSGPPGGGLGEELADFLRKLPERFSNRAEAREIIERTCPDPSIALYLIATLGQGVEFPFDRKALLATISASKEADVRSWVKEALEAGIPILVLRGAESHVWSEAGYEAEKKYFEGFPSIRFETISGTGHGLPFEKRAEFVERLLSWRAEWENRWGHS